MAIPLIDKPNVDGVSTAYPFGKIRDGELTGTPVNAEVYGDFHQFFAKLLHEANITANGQPENATDGFQYMAALKSLINPDWVSISLPGSATGVIKYKKYNNKVTLLMQIDGLSGVIDEFITLPLAIRPTSAFTLPAVIFPITRSQYVTIQAGGAIISDAPTGVYFCLDYYLD